jgi:ketosteroid isomerase-like protein
LTLEHSRIELWRRASKSSPATAWFARSFGRGDVPAIVSTVSDQVEWTFNVARSDVPWHVPIQGKAALPQFFANLQHIDMLAFEPRAFLTDANQISAVVHIDYNVKKTGRRVMQDQIHLWRFDEAGKVASCGTSKIRHCWSPHTASSRRRRPAWNIPTRFCDIYDDGRWERGMLGDGVGQRTFLLGALSMVTAAALLASGNRPAAGGGPQGNGAALAAGHETVAVIVELFTSEGCSSCPPADDFLRELAHDQTVPGVRVLTLGEHVDYWDRLEWRDLFSAPSFSIRQSEYDARVFHTGGVYTPQLVIDGRLQQVGSDMKAVRRAISQAARSPKANMTVSARLDATTRLRIAVQVPTAQPFAVNSADVIVAVTEDGLTTDVRRGDNRGRVLKHGSVVRSLTPVGSFTSNRSFADTASIAVGPTWAIRNLHVVAFLHERQSRRIVGASARISRISRVTTGGPETSHV